MEAAKNAVNSLLNRQSDDTTTTTTNTTGTTGQSGNPVSSSINTGGNYGSETTPGTTQQSYTRDDEYVDRYGATGKGAGSGATAQVDSGSTTTGTALGGRASGNTAESATRATGGGSEDADGYGTGLDTASTDDYGRPSTTSTRPYESGAGFDARPAKPTGTEPTAYHQVTGSSEGTAASRYGIGQTSTGINQSDSGQKLTDGAADYRSGPGGVSGIGSDSYTAGRNTTGISSETYPQTSTSNTSGLPGVASGDTYPRSGDLSSHSHTGLGTTGGLTDSTSGDTYGRSGDLSSDSRTRTTATGEKIDAGLGGGKKLTGTGEDGSHSAVFGLTPDGHVHEETSHHSGGLKPAHSKAVNDTDDRRRELAGGERIADQINDPRVNQRGDGRDPTYNSGSNTKPGAGFQAGSPDQTL